MKRVVIVLVVLICLVGGGIGGYMVWQNSPDVKIEKALLQEDYDLVVSLYGDVKSTELKNDVKEELLGVAKGRYNGYLQGDVSYSDMLTFFDLVERNILRNDESIREFRAQAKELNTSKEVFEEAERLRKDGKYMEAIASYEKVSLKDTENREKADQYIYECKEAYLQEILDKADALIEAESYEEAKSFLLDAMKELPEEDALKDKLAKIQEAMAVSLDGTYTTQYNFGDLIAAELGINGYRVYFPAVMVMEIKGEEVTFYIDENCIRDGLDALTHDAGSMEAIYSVVEDYGFTKGEADLLVTLAYKGSYTDFIMDNFGGEIQTALREYRFSDVCFADKHNFYLGTTGKNDDSYFSYSEDGIELTFESYTGENYVLNMMKYPLVFTR